MHDRRAAAVLLHAGARVPLGAKKVLAFRSRDDDDPPALGRPPLEVVDGGCHRIDEDGVDANALYLSVSMRAYQTTDYEYKPF